MCMMQGCCSEVEQERADIGHHWRASQPHSVHTAYHIAFRLHDACIWQDSAQTYMLSCGTSMLTVSFVPRLYPGVHAYMVLHMIIQVCMPIQMCMQIFLCVAVCRQAGSE